MYDFIQEDNLPAIQECMKDGETVKAQIMKAVSEFSKGDLQDILEGAKDMASVVQVLPDDLKDCKAMKSDVAKIEAWGKAKLTPQGLAAVAKNVLANWAAIQSDVGKLNTDWKAGKSYD